MDKAFGDDDSIGGNFNEETIHEAIEKLGQEQDPYCSYVFILYINLSVSKLRV